MPTGNDEYTPTCADSCSAQTLAVMGDTTCPNSANVEIAEINELYLDEKSATLNVPNNPVATYTAWADNEAVLLTWKAAVSNSGSGTVRYLEGIGEIPQPTETNLTLAKGKITNIGTKMTLTYTVSVVDRTTEQFMRSIQACKGEYHLWFATDSYFYGGDNGVIANVEACYPTFAGGRGDSKKWIIQFGWQAKAIAVSDAKPW